MTSTTDNSRSRRFDKRIKQVKHKARSGTYRRKVLLVIEIVKQIN